MPPKKILPDALFLLLAENPSDQEFEYRLKQILQQGGDINVIHPISKKTILDVAEFVPGRNTKIKILERYGAKTTCELNLVPQNLGEKIIAPFDQMGSLMAPVDPFDFNAGGTMYSVTDFIRTNKFSKVADQLRMYAPAVGLLTEFGDGIGTAFLIAPNLIMLSRHCLNGVLLSDLQIQFTDGNDPIQIKGIVENGDEVELDYAILLLETSVVHKPLALSINRQPMKATVIGYDFEEELCFTNFYLETPEQASVASHQLTYQQSNFGWSGSPYLNESNLVYALHQNAGLERKESLHIAQICEQNKESILHKLIDGSLKTVNYTRSQKPVPFFRNSAESQYDEGVNRGRTLGKNPSVARDELGGDRNVVCREVLYRWASKPKFKARYTGEVKDKKKWIEDWKNWEVNVRKENNSERQWVKLNPSEIQMGHKLSAVSYWVYGYNKKNPNPTQFFKDYSKKHTKQEVIAKKQKHDIRYAEYKKPGFKCVEEGSAVINRRFMYDARNYRFECKKPNEANGGAEGRELTYDTIFSKGAKQTSLKAYRDLRNDKATAPTIRADLDQRKADLQIHIHENHASFKHK